MGVPSRLRLRRWMLGGTLDDLEAATGLGRADLSRLERDKPSPDRDAKVARIERVLEAHATPDSTAALERGLRQAQEQVTHLERIVEALPDPPPPPPDPPPA
jgi:hypothetical protein